MGARRGTPGSRRSRTGFPWRRSAACAGCPRTVRRARPRRWWSGPFSYRSKGFGHFGQHIRDVHFDHRAGSFTCATPACASAQPARSARSSRHGAAISCTPMGRPSVPVGHSGRRHHRAARERDRLREQADGGPQWKTLAVDVDPFGADGGCGHRCGGRDEHVPVRGTAHSPCRGRRGGIAAARRYQAAGCSAPEMKRSTESGSKSAACVRSRCRCRGAAFAGAGDEGRRAGLCRIGARPRWRSRPARRRLVPPLRAPRGRRVLSK